jgi:hypothetical protein
LTISVGPIEFRALTADIVGDYPSATPRHERYQPTAVVGMSTMML